MNMDKKKSIRVMLVDDHRIVREGIKMLLSVYHDIEVVAEASGSDELFALLVRCKAAVMLLDISMPGMTGIEIAERLKLQHPEIAIIILTANTDENNIYDAVKAGVKGFIPKDSGHEEIAAAIRKVDAGEEYFADAVAHSVLKAFLRKAREGQDRPAGNEGQQITQREKEIIEQIFGGLSYKEIAEKLSISVRTVETHKNNIMKKLGIRSIADLMKYALRKGIVKI